MRISDRPLFRVLLLAALLAACAPEDIDITPTATPTPVPTITPTPQTTPTATPVPAPTEVPEILLVDVLIDSVPDIVTAGSVQWRVDSERGASNVRNVQNGIARRIYLTERQGGKASFTIGVFDTEADALVYYDFVRELRTVLENGESSDEFPLPNLFGSGLYGSNAIFSQENYFIEVGIEQFSGTAGNPLPSLSRQAFRIVQDTLLGVAAAAEAGEVVDLTLSQLVASLPEQVMVADVAWERGGRSLQNVVDGTAASIPWRAGDLRATLYLALFETEAAAANFQPVSASNGAPGRVTLALGEQLIVLVCESPASGAEVARILAEALNALAAN